MKARDLEWICAGPSETAPAKAHALGGEYQINIWGGSSIPSWHLPNCAHGARWIGGDSGRTFEQAKQACQDDFNRIVKESLSDRQELTFQDAINLAKECANFSECVPDSEYHATIRGIEMVVRRLEYTLKIGHVDTQHEYEKATRDRLDISPSQFRWLTHARKYNGVIRTESSKTDIDAMIERELMFRLANGEYFPTDAGCAAIEAYRAKTTNQGK